MAEKECDGNCYGHKGPIRKVLVYGFPDKSFEPLAFWYCSVAIEKDNKAGFKVETLDVTTCKRCGYDIPDQNVVNPDRTCCVVASELEAECDKLLEENKGLKERIQSIQGDDADYILAAEKERDEWRGMAAQLLEALQSLHDLFDEEIRVRCAGLPESKVHKLRIVSMLQVPRNMAKNALEAYSKLSGEKGEGK